MPFKSKQDKVEYDRQYSVAHREQKAETDRQRRNDPTWLEHHTKIQREWRNNNPQYKQRYGATHQEQISKSGSAYYKANKDASHARSAASRARKREAFVESVSPAVVFERDAGVCQICLLPIGESKWHIDHVMPLVAGGEHSYANVQLSHASCNLSKGARWTG